MNRLLYALSLFVIGCLHGCGLLIATQDGEFTRDDLLLLANDLRTGASIAVIVDPTLEGSAYIILARGVADRWDGYYKTGQQVNVDLIIGEARQLAKNISAALQAEGASPEKAARVEAIIELMLNNLVLLLPPGTPPIVQPPVAPGGASCVC